MILSNLKKNLINLGDYDYQKDIRNRLVLSRLSNFEKEVLGEIIHGSIKTPLSRFVEDLNSPLEKVMLALEKFAKVGLLKMTDSTIEVDKPLRKYYESQYEKFDSEFKPDLNFVKESLKKVPIHVLPTWYSLPKTTDNIFQSIVDKYVHTPQIYKRHLFSLNFEDPILKHIIDDVCNSPELQVSAASLRQKYKISREKFEEYMLLLEFNLACFLSYIKVDSNWEEVVTPLYEWMEYVFYTQKMAPNVIKDSKTITIIRKPEFGFILDQNAVLQAGTKSPLKVLAKKNQGRYVLNEESLKKVVSKSKNLEKSIVEEPTRLQEYFGRIVERLLLVDLLELQGDKLIVTKTGLDWLKEGLENQVSFLYRHPRTKIIKDHFNFKNYKPKDIHTIEKSLRRIPHGSWVYVEEFVNKFTASIGIASPIVITLNGQRWEYALPKHSSEDIEFIAQVIKTRLFELGMVSLGAHNKKDCFSVTSFGYSMVES